MMSNLVETLKSRAKSFRRKAKPEQSHPETGSFQSVDVQRGDPNRLLSAVLEAIASGDNLKAASLAGGAARLFRSNHKFYPIFTSLYGYAHAYMIWFQSWDYREAVQAMASSGQPLANQQDHPFAALLYDFILAEVNAVECEASWMRYEFTPALALSSQCITLFRKVEANCGQPPKALSADPAVKILCNLAKNRRVYEEAVATYIQVYQSLVEGTAGWPRQVEAAAQVLKSASGQLAADGDVSDADEIRALTTSLHRALNLQRSFDQPLQISGWDFTWTYRTSFPRLLSQEIITRCPQIGGPAEEKSLSIPGTVPLLAIGCTVLNDVFKTDIGEEHFRFAALYFPEFTLRIGHLPLLKVAPVIRLYAMGVVAVHFQILPQEESKEDLNVSQLQFLRLIGLPQTPGVPIHIPWLSEEEFHNFPEVADALLVRLKPLFENAGRPGSQAAQEFYARAGLTLGGDQIITPVERWTAYTIIQISELHSPRGFPLERTHPQEMAALSQPIPESVDSLDVWTRLAYRPQANLADHLQALEHGSLLFVSRDHVLMCMPNAAGWVKDEYQDLTEFQLNASVAIQETLGEIRSEINKFRKEVKAIPVELIENDFRPRLEQQRQGIERLHHLKSQLLAVNSLSNAHLITAFDEHSALLEGIAKAINLSGAITQAENLSDALLSIERGWEQLSRLIYEQQAAEIENRRRKFENVLAFILQVIGITEIISSILGIILIGDREHFFIPLGPNDALLEFTGYQLKLFSLWSLIVGVILILIAWFYISKRSKPR